MKYIKKIITLLLCLNFLLFSLLVSGEEPSVKTVGSPSVACRSAVLMEASTGQILYELNPDEALPPASVTKIMTLLLVMEAIEAGKLKYDDMITASANACSMGGSQIYLKEGEQMSAEDLIKSVVIASANDAAVALAEHIYGSEEAFVLQMNEKARSLGMTNTNFENTNGLDDTVTNHVTSARDIAIMSRQLIKYKKILEFSSIWMDTIRNGEFGLTNTNRLVRFYKGATGLKTGSTAKAGFCISATAERNGMTLICVIMGAATRDIRNASATSMLDWGFSNYGVYQSSAPNLSAVKVVGGKVSEYTPQVEGISLVVEKNLLNKIECVVDLPEKINAPLSVGDKIGSIRYVCGEEELARVDITVEKQIDKIRFYDLFITVLCLILGN